MSGSIHVREAVPADLRLLYGLIRELARFEKLEHDCTGTEAQLHESLFGSIPRAHALLAFHGESPAGFAVYYFTFSTFRARPLLYLEDLYVKPEFRGKGIGRQLFAHLARIAHTTGCARIEWSVLNWNQAAIDFYKSLGAIEEPSWKKYRLPIPAEGLEMG